MVIPSHTESLPKIVERIAPPPFVREKVGMRVKIKKLT